MTAEQRRRFLPAIFLGAVVVIVLLFSRNQPVTVDAEYRLGNQRGNIVELGVTWVSDGGKTIHASYNYRGRKVPRAQTHRLELPRDIYELTLTVTRDDATMTIREHRVTVEGDATIELSAVPE